MVVTYKLEGLDCAHCAEEIRIGAEKITGVSEAQMNFLSKKLQLTLNGKKADDSLLEEVRTLVGRLEPDVKVLSDTGEAVETRAKGAGKFEVNGQLIRVFVALGLLLLGVLVPWPNKYLELGILLAAYLSVGGTVLLRAGRNILKGRIFDENFLMSVATVGALVVGDFPEAVAVMLFYQVGEYFQEYAVNRSRRSITELMDIRPDTAEVYRNGEFISVHPGTVEIKERIRVLPGGKVPLDGVIISGSSSLDTAALTGESMPRAVSVGDKAISGCVNREGTLEIEVEKAFGESTVSKILELVENASSKKAKTEAFITRFARYYTPCVVIAAVMLAFLPPLFGLGTIAEWGYRALTFLVISCPCALVISVPLSFFGGIGAASKEGVLVKGAASFERLAKCGTMVFDKTGTLTKGSFGVSGIYPAEGQGEIELLALGAAAESQSTHPVGQSIVKDFQARGEGMEVYKSALNGLTSKEVAGQGVEARNQSGVLLAGNTKLLEAHGITSAKALGGTAVHVAKDGGYMGYITLADTLKPDAKAAVTGLKAAGVGNVVMLTGDAKEVAQKVASEAGLDSFRAELLPGDKVSALEELMRDNKEGWTAFVGDGINDAPVLARADIGIAMGGLGSDAAVEAADIVLMTDQPSKLVPAMGIARHTLRVVTQNIVFALGVKGIALALGAFGIAGMWIAVFADVGVSVLAILNALRKPNIK